MALFWFTVALLGFLVLFWLANRKITILGLATNGNGVVQSDLMVVLFMDEIEFSRTISYNTSWDGHVPTSEDLKRGANFEIYLPNYFGYRSNPFELTVFLAANEVQTGQSRRYVTPNNHQLTLVAINPEYANVDISGPLRLTSDGTIEAIPKTDSMYSSSREIKIKEGNQKGVWLQISLAMLAVFLGIGTNLIASFLQEEYELINDRSRFVIVVVVFVCVFSLSIFLSSILGGI